MSGSRKIFRRAGYFGNYRSWSDAREASGGYDADVILEKVKNALVQVKNGTAVYERDSVLFDHIEYSWPLLTALLWVASQNRNSLKLIDYGGSLGSTYYQNRKFLSTLDNLQWNVVEQKSFVQTGKQLFENAHLKFYYSIEECIEEGHVDTVVLSSVIQYLEKPNDLISELIDRNFRFLIFDRTPFLLKGKDRISVQKVPHTIYKASYPSWLFNRETFLIRFSPKYELIAEFESPDRLGDEIIFKGFIFKAR